MKTKKKAIEGMRKYGITQKMVSKWANYSSEQSFHGSSGKEDILRLVESVISFIEETIVERITER